MPPIREKKPSPSLALVPNDADYIDLVHAARECQACDLYKRATQTVFGEGPTPAPMMLVGEQPGDQEDLKGHPFVGPAGRILDAALEEAGIPRDQVYVTNAVKHFKWEPRGKRRLHGKPNAVEIHACNGWLQAEVAVVKPTVIVCLGATASQVFLGRAFRLTKERGQVKDGGAWAPNIVATYHPSALLRMMNDEEAYAKARADFESDLATAAKLVTFVRERRRRAVARPRLGA
jgi:uracil-DNA glycosylase